MKKINQPTTKIFCRLVAMLGHEQQIRRYTDGLNKMIIQRYGIQIETPHGNADIIRIAWLHNTSGIDVREPEMRFLVIDKKDNANENTPLVLPYYFADDNTGEEQRTVEIEDGRITALYKYQQRRQVRSATFFLHTLGHKILIG